MRILLLALLDSWVASSSLLAADAGYHREVTVTSPTRLDWSFVLANQSVAEPPKEWLANYDSTKQRYEQFVPDKTPAPREGWPLVLFISAGNEPASWKNLEPVCRQQGIVFASPFGAGNNTSMPKRVRIILDVLDDLRQRHTIDPDRTYIAGFSGGGRVACAVAFALPELFGGVMPVCAGGELRDEQWLRHRVKDRLSVAFITGTNDFNRGEVERFRTPLFEDIGIRAQATVVTGLGHGVPNDKVFDATLKWLDEAVAERRKLATKFPASRINSDSAPSRVEWSQSLLAEGLSRTETRETRFSGLMQLQGVRVRWADLPAAEKALAVLTQYEQNADRSWEDDDVAEQRRELIARARALDAYGSGELPPQYIKQRPEMLKAAIDLWKQVIADGQNKQAVDEAKRRLPVLDKLLQKP
jgi:predicted esterase